MKAINIYNKLLSASVFFLCFSITSLQAQEKLSVRVASTSTGCANGIKVFTPPTGVGNDFCQLSLGVCGDMENEGTVEIAEKAEVTFMGTRWTNKTAAEIPGTGTVSFEKGDCTEGEQEIDGGGDCTNTTSFPNIKIQNKENVRVLNSGTKVRSKVEFAEGKVILDHDLCIGDDDEGEITGYCQDKYFVQTDNPNASVGFLKRDKVGADKTDFPVGTSESYNPATVKHNGTAERVSLRVFKDVYASGKTGTKVNGSSAARTWEVQGASQTSDIDLEIQFDETMAGPGITAGKVYLSRYVGVNGNTDGGELSESKWDFVGTDNCFSPVQPSEIDDCVEGDPNHLKISRSGMTDMKSSELFTGAICLASALPVELGDLKATVNDCIAEVTFTTYSEVNAWYFAVEKSYDGRNFKTVEELEAAGDSSEELEYSIMDEELKRKNYYRIKMVDLDGTFTYSNIISVNAECGDWEEISDVYPNPARNELNVVYFSQQMNSDIEVRISDLLGRTVIMEHFASQRGENIYSMNLKNLSGGTYLVHILVDGQPTPPKKFVKMQGSY